MSPSSHSVHVVINHARISFEHSRSTGKQIKHHAGIPADHILCLEASHHSSHGEGEHDRRGAELTVINDDEVVTLENGLHFWSHPAAAHRITVSINRKNYEFADPHQTGHSLKERAGISASDVLFLHRPNEDEVITDDTKILLKCDDCFHSAPPADYGSSEAEITEIGAHQFEFLPQSGGWKFLVVSDYPLPHGYSADKARLLVKLPPSFPDAAPDMFWLSPPVRTSSGGAPQGTSADNCLATEWQQFSWHLRPGAWKPGISTLGDYMRCIRARLEKRN